MANTVVENAWRVLQSAGMISGAFRWSPGSPNLGRDVRDVLGEEGVRFDALGRAASDQRLGAEELTALNGIELELATPSPDGGSEVAFFEQLVAHQPEAIVQSVSDLMNHWRALGGSFRWGHGTHQKTCTFAATEGVAANAPPVINPRGTLEINFQFFRAYVPFNDLRLREELQTRLNAMRDVDVRWALLSMRPPIGLATALRPDNLPLLFETLRWFRDVVDANPLSGRRADEIDSRL